MNVTLVTDRETLTAYHQVEAAAFAHDFVALPADPLEEYLPILDGQVRAGEAFRLWVWHDAGAPVAATCLRWTTLDNLESANLQLSVHPDYRRRGHGRTAVQHALEQVRGMGRTRLFAEAPWQPNGEPCAWDPFLSGFGFRRVLDDYRRTMPIEAVGSPVAPPPGYRVVQWTDHAPDDVVDGCAYLMGRMILDAPMGDMDYEQEKWDAERFRAKEAMTRERLRTRVSTAVVHEATGTVAGFSDIGVSALEPAVAYQWETIVDPDHRGHGLGRVLKTWNHQRLVATVPGVRFVNTWNATTNSFMIGINEELGFRIAEQWSEWQLDL